MTEEYIDPPVSEKNQYFSIVLAGITRCNDPNYPDDETKKFPFFRGDYHVFHKKNYYIHRKKSAIASIEFILSGGGTVKINGKEFHPVKNDTLFLKMGEEQEFYSNGDEPWVKIWFSVTGRLVKSLIEAYGLGEQTIFQCNIKPYIDHVHSLLCDKKLTPEEIQNKVALCFHEALQVMSDSIESLGNASLDAETIKHYIDMNVYSVVTLDQLSKLIFRSPAQTNRVFKQRYNMTPYNYYNKARISAAISLLKNTNITVREIAAKLQFSDEHYFSYFFKKKTGKRPTDFRK